MSRAEERLERVLIVHNAYQQRGGEDSVVEAEGDLLRSRGHEVVSYVRHNDELNGVPMWRAAAQTFWSARTTAELAEVLARVRPDVIHSHNTFPLVSPSLYWAAAKAGVPVVQTLHNFRLHCPQAMYLREGKVCEDCLGHVPWRGALRGCYRDSIAQSVVLAGMVSAHRLLGTWSRKVTRYIALNEFCRQKFIAGGLPAERIVVKPNFVDFAAPAAVEREGFLFVGRLSPEKGIGVLGEAAKDLCAANIRVAGTGPDASLLNGIPGVSLLGALSGDAVRAEMSRALALVLPSIWYENFPRTLVEAMGCGLPVIASRIGALAELVEDGVTGLLFDPGKGLDLAEKMKWALAHPDAMSEMGKSARSRYESCYTAGRNYEQLIGIYRDAVIERKGEKS